MSNARRSNPARPRLGLHREDAFAYPRQATSLDDGDCASASSDDSQSTAWSSQSQSQSQSQGQPGGGLPRAGMVRAGPPAELANVGLGIRNAG